MAAPGFRSLSIKDTTVKKTDGLRRQLEAIPSRAVVIDLAVKFALSKEKEFLRFAEKRQGEG